MMTALKLKVLQVNYYQAHSQNTKNRTMQIIATIYQRHQRHCDAVVDALEQECPSNQSSNPAEDIEETMLQDLQQYR